MELAKLLVIGKQPIQSVLYPIEPCVSAGYLGARKW
jgi:hypothetical protein